MPLGRPLQPIPMSQGKSWNKDEVIVILEPYFRLGCNVAKACSYAGIPRTTVQTWIEQDEELRLKIEAWQNEISVSARREWKRAIEGGNTTSAQEWMKRKEKDEFSDRTETDITSKGESISVTSEALAIAKEYEEKLKKGLNA